MKTSRRHFLKATGAAATAPLFPAVLTADKAGTKPAIVGEGAHQYECHHGWGEAPDHIKWQDTHGVTVDGEGLVYIKHRGGKGGDTIVVFDGQGKFVRSFGQEYAGGGHGIDLRKEGSDEFLYLSDTKNGVVAKTTLEGKLVWKKKGIPGDAAMFYGEKGRYSPTNICFAPDGGYYVADGYGSSYIHQFDKKDRWVRSWGGPGSAAGKMKTPHGIWLDDRP
ncbi:MAG: twin-arginine translocation signal domain-containing protein, partial [Verrucomicrobiota bacterium]